MRGSPPLLRLGLAAALLLFAVVANAQTVTVTGTTAGIFQSSGTPVSQGILVFTPGGFNVTTTGGFAAIGSSPGSPDNLGTLTLSSGTANFTGEKLNLTVTFAAPPGLNGGSPQQYVGTLTGTATPGAGGATVISWTNNGLTLNYPPGPGNNGGTVRLFLDTRSVTTPDAGQPPTSVTLTGFVLATQNPITTPEPSTAALLLPLLAPMGLLLRRRR